jgi:Fic family protein
METDLSAALNREEPITQMEPLLISESSRHRAGLVDLAFELAKRSSGFRRSLPPGLVQALADLVRAMNCYYSNLIEGHNTHPVDIEKALKGDYSADTGKRSLQLEAKAHITVQQWIDEGGLKGRATHVDALREVHRRFCELLPDEYLWVTMPSTGERIRVEPGELRHRDVEVGRHVAVSPGALPRFLNRFEEAFGRLGQSETVVAAAAAHHRLLWIHPFLDGNGRVARLMSQATLLDALDTGAVWSISRGLARAVTTYKDHLANCDLPRRNDLDGRGNLSEEALANFTRFFLESCLDQVSFMESLMDPSRLRARIQLWVEEEVRAGALPSRSDAIIDAILYRGELPRGEVPGLLGLADRHARRPVAALVQRGVLVSGSSRAPLRLAFPSALASRWLPGLFPEQPGLFPDQAVSS